MTQEMIEKKEIWRALKTNFTEKEKLKMAEQISGCIRERNRLEEEFASVKKQYASDISKQEAEISSLAERFNTGWEMRRVECIEVKDFNNGTVRIFRLDKDDPQERKYQITEAQSFGFECVEERPMSGEERQMGLFEEKEETPAGIEQTETPENGKGEGLPRRLPPQVWV